MFCEIGELILFNFFGEYKIGIILDSEMNLSGFERLKIYTIYGNDEKIRITNDKIKKLSF